MTYACLKCLVKGSSFASKFVQALLHKHEEILALALPGKGFKVTKKELRAALPVSAQSSSAPAPIQTIYPEKPPQAYRDILADFGPVYWDSEEGIPIGWGYPLIRVVSAPVFESLRKLGELTCVTPPGPTSAQWCVVMRWLTHDEAIKKYGEVTKQTWGPLGKWKSTTYGETKFTSRHMHPERLAQRAGESNDR